MKKWIHASKKVEAAIDQKQAIEGGESKDYEVRVEFAGLGGVEDSYIEFADSEEEAIDAAIEDAKEDLEVVNVEYLGDGDYEVEIGFGESIGGTNLYTISADDSDEAEELALDDAYWDLEGTVVHDDEDDEDVDAATEVVEELDNHDAFIKWLNEYFGYDWDGENHVDVMDIPEDEYYALEDQYREETGREVI